MRQRWHNLLCFLGIRNEFDWAPPSLGPEVNHPYVQHAALQCCEHCGGGKLNAIHKPPFDARRTAEILGAGQLAPGDSACTNPEQTRANWEGYPTLGPQPSKPETARSYVERERGR